MTPDPNTPFNTPDGPPQVETGNRFEETHLEADDGQMVRVSHLVKPQVPLARHEATVRAGRPDKPGEPVEDVKVDAAASSVWDARPSEKQALKDVPSHGSPQASPLNPAPSQAQASTTDDSPPPGEEVGDIRHPPPFPPSDLVSKRAGG